MNLTEAKRQETHHSLSVIRQEEQRLRSENLPLGDESIALKPEDIELMFAAKMALEMMEQNVRVSNIKSSYLRAYGEDYPSVSEKLEQYSGQFLEDRQKYEKILKKAVQKHPLTSRLIGIRGLGEYSLGLVMGMIKDVSRFRTPSALMVYAGIGVKYGYKVCKKNIHIIKQKSIEIDGVEFKGYNTKLSGRMYCIGESLMKANGWFKGEYDRLKSRLIQRAMNNGECFKPTPEQIKESKGVMKKDRWYMKGKKHQSIEAWSHSNAMVRIQRTLLHLVYTEWRTYLDLETRIPYPIEYLGHGKMITLEDVLAVDGK